MSIKRKILLYFTVSILFVVLFGLTYTYVQIKDYFLQDTVSKLEAVISIQKERFEEAVSRYIEWAELIAAQEKIRDEFMQYQSAPSEDVYESVVATLHDSHIAIPTIRHISLMSMERKVIISTDKEQEGVVFEDQAAFEKGVIGAYLVGVVKSDQNAPVVRVLAPLVVAHKTIGVVEVIATNQLLSEVTEDYTGLGESGEVLIASKNQSGDAVFLNPLRFDSGAALRRAISKDRTNVPITRAVAGEEAVFTEGNVLDYRSVPVVSVTRYIEATEWGVVAKIDMEEILRPVIATRNALVVLGVLLFAVLTGIVYVVAGIINKPIKDLVETTEAFGHGNLNRRAKVFSSDELGHLSESFNHMADELSDLYSKMEEKVADQTAQLRASEERLKEKLEETEKLNNVMIGRELRMVELKEEIKRLKDTTQ